MKQNVSCKCKCSQLSVEFINQKAISNNELESLGLKPIASINPEFIYFKNESIAGTTGNAVCIGGLAEHEDDNLYQCDSCDTVLFSVPQQQPSIIGVAREALSKEQPESLSEQAA